MTSVTTLITILVILGFGTTESAKILAIPIYHYSHVNLMAVAASHLDTSGHNVTLMVSNTFASVPTKFNLKPLVYQLTKDAVMKDVASRVMDDGQSKFDQIYKGFTQLLPLFGKVCEQVLGNKELMDFIEKEKFDLVLMDGAPPLHCFYVIPYKFDITYMSINVMLDPWSIGVPASAAIEPMQAVQVNNHMSFFQRLQMAVIYTFFSVIPPRTFSSSYHVAKYAPEKPLVTAHELYSKSEIFLVNHEIMCLDYPRISTPHYQYIGGSSARPPKPLPEDLEDFVNDATDGVVVISFGSLPAWQNTWKTLKSKFIHVFKNIPQRAVILYSLDDKIDDFPSNMKVLKWLPQNDLLGHSNTRLFVTHGGNNGQLETTYHGIPSLVVPIAGDQIYNGIRVEAHNFGKMVQNWDVITEDELLKTFQEVLTNQTYTQNVKKCSRIIKSQPSTKERIIYWVNHILEFGGSHLRPPSVDMPLYQLLMVDIIFFVTAVSIVFAVLSFMCCRCCIRRCCLQNKPKEKKA